MSTPKAGSAETGSPKTVFPGFGSLADDATELIARLSDLRRSRGLSQTEVAARMGTSQSALARLESGQADLRLSTLARYARALDTGISFALLDRAEAEAERP